MPGSEENILSNLPENIQIWWRSVQKTLDDAGLELNLSTPEDTARLFIASYRKKGYDDYAVTLHYAFDPQMRNVDIDTISPEEIIGRQSKNPAALANLIENMYRRAQEGLLFVRPLPGQPFMTRQLLVAADGMARLGNDIDHATEEEKQSTRLIDEPEVPARPSEEVYQRAALGNAAAQKAVAAYEEKLAAYPEKMDEWASFREEVDQNPGFYRLNRNMAVVFRHYLQNMYLNFDEYTDKLVALHKEAEARKIPEEERTVRINREKQAEIFRENLSDLFGSWTGSKMKYGVWKASPEDSFARLLVSRMELRRGEEALANGAGRNFIPLTDEETDDAVRKLKESKEFRQIKLLLSQDDLGSLMDEEKLKPAETRRLMEELCDRLITPEGQKELRAEWWRRLQESLDNAGFELDINSPEDLSRLLIFDIAHPGRNRFTAGPYFAADPAKQPIDLKNISPESITERLKGGVPDEATMQNILDAAFEGRLFVLSHKEAAQPQKPRPVRLNFYSVPVVDPDADHMSEADQQMTALLEEPAAPENPGSWNALKAGLGSTEAAGKIAAYQRKLQTFERQSEIWTNIQRSNPALKTRAQNSYIIAQTFFANAMEHGKELQDFEEITTRLHRQAEARKMADYARAAEEINRQRERIVELVKAGFSERADRRLINGQTKLTEEDRIFLSQILASKREIERAERAIRSGSVVNYTPKTAEGIKELAENIRAYERELLNDARFDGNFLLNLVRNASRGEAETLAFLDLSEKRAEEQRRREMLAPEVKEGLRPDVLEPKRGFYSSEATKYVSLRLEAFLNAGLTEQERSVPENEAAFLRQHAPEFLAIIKNDPLEFTFKFSENNLQDYITTMKGDAYRPLSAAERSARAKNGKAIREKYSLYMAERTLAESVALRGGFAIDRMLQPILTYGAFADILPTPDDLRNRFSDEIKAKHPGMSEGVLSTDTFLSNDFIRDIFENGTDQDKRNFYDITLNLLEKIDLSGIDVMNDDNLVQNFDRLRPVLAIGVEMTNLIQAATKYGIDLTGEDKKPLIEKMGMLADTAYMIRLRVDTMSHPLYAELRYEDFYENFDMTIAEDLNGNPVDTEEFFEDRGEKNRAAAGSIDQIGMIGDFVKNNPLFDITLPPAEREKKYRKTFWDSRKEVMPKKPGTVMRRGELIEDDAEHYNDFAEDAELAGIEDTEMSAEMKASFAEEAPSLALFDESDGDGLPDPAEAERNEYLTKLRQNIRLIQEYIPGFTMTEEEINACVSRERLTLHKDAVRAQENIAKARNAMKSDYVPEAFARLKTVFFDHSGTAEADARNARVMKALTGSAPEDNAERRRMAEAIVHGVEKLDPEKISFALPIEEAGRYALSHVPEGMMGVDIGYFMNHSPATLGFSFNPQKQEYLEQLRRMGESIGGVGGFYRNLMSSEAFLTIPFEKLSSEQCLMLYTQLQKRQDELPVGIAEYKAAFSFVNGREKLQMIPAPEPVPFTAEDIIDNKSESLLQLRERLDDLSGKLRLIDEGDAWPHTGKYDAFLAALQNVQLELAGIDGTITADKAAAIGSSLLRLTTLSRNYSSAPAGPDPSEAEKQSLAQQIGNLAAPYSEGNVYLNALVEAHNGQLAREYYQELAEPTEQERIFKTGLALTEELRGRLEALRKIEVPETGELNELELGSRMLEAREKLTQLVGRKDIQPEELLKPMAELVQGERALKFYADKENGTVLYDTLVDHALSDEGFKAMLNGMDSDELNCFLAGTRDEKWMYYAGGSDSAAYEELAGKLAERIDERLSGLYGELEQHTNFSRNRLAYICVEDTCLSALYEEEKAKLSAEKELLNPNGTSMTDAQKFQSIGLSFAARTLAEALLQGRSVSFMKADPATSLIAAEQGRLSQPMKLSDFDLSELPEMTQAEKGTALAYAEAQRPAPADSEKLAADIAENEKVMAALNWFESMNQASVFSNATKHTYFDAFTEASGLKITEIETNVQQKLSRGGASALVAAAMVVSGKYSIDDIFDPTRLLAEKSEWGSETAARLLSDDSQWVADINLRARDILSRDMLARAEKVDFSDTDKLFTDENRIMNMEAVLCFELGQNLDTDLTKQAQKEWYEKHCGDMTPEEFEKELDSRAIMASSFVSSSFTNEQHLLEAAAGINTKYTQDGLTIPFTGMFIEQRRRENPGKALNEILSYDDGVMNSAYSYLDVHSRKIKKEFDARRRSDPRALARDLLSGRFMEKYDASIEMSDGIPMPKLVPTESPIAKRTERFLNAGAVTLTTKQRLQEIRLINEDLKAAGVKPMAEEEMLEKASDPKLIQDYLTAKTFCDRMEKTYEFQKQNSYPIHNALKRSAGYLFDLSGTAEAKKKNDELAARLQTDEDVDRVIRENFHMMQETDESLLYADDLPGMIRAFGNDPQKLQLCFEMEHIMAEVSKNKKGPNGEPYTFGLPQEEYLQLKEKYKIFENASGFEQHIRVNASPLHLFMPNLGPDDLAKLMMYYTTSGQQEKYHFVETAASASADELEEKYVPFIAQKLKEEGFLGKQEAGVSYETFDEKGDLLLSRQQGLTRLSAGEAQNIRFVKKTKKDDGTFEQKEVSLNRNEIIKAYDRAHLSERLDAAYKPARPAEFPVVEDALIKDAKKAVLLFRMELSSEFKAADNTRKEAMYQEWVQAIREGRDEHLNFLLRQPRAIQDAMVSEMTCSLLPERKHFLSFSGTAAGFEAERALWEDPAGKYIRGMFLPKTDSSEVRSSFRDYSGTGEEYTDQKQLDAQREADRIVLPVPEGLSPENAAAAAMACFFTPETMESSYRLTLKGSGAGSTVFTDIDYAQAGFHSVVDNIFVKDDARENIQEARLFLPGARANAKALLEQYQSGNPAGLAEAAQKSLDFLLKSYRRETMRGTRVSMSAMKVILEVADLVSSPELKKYVSPDKEQRELIENIRLEQKLSAERQQLEEEITMTFQQKKIEKDYLGVDPNQRGSYENDAEFKEKLLDYQARKLYFLRIQEANSCYDEAVLTAAAGDVPTQTGLMSKRPLTRAQKNMLRDPEAYLRYLKERIISGKEEFFAMPLQAKTWEEAESAFKSGVPANNLKVQNVVYSEQIGLAGAIKQYLKHSDENPRLKDLSDELAKLPCMEEGEKDIELSAEEMLRRADLYDAAAEHLQNNGIHLYAMEENARLGLMEPKDVTQKLMDTLAREVKILRGSAVLAAEEGAYEHAITLINLEKAGRSVNIIGKDAPKQAEHGLSFEEAEKRIAEENAARAEALKKYEQPDDGLDESEIDPEILREKPLVHKSSELRYGRPTKDTLLQEVLEYVKNTPDQIKYGTEFRKTTQFIESIANLKLLRSPNLKLSAYQESVENFDKGWPELQVLADKANQRQLDEDSGEAQYITNLQNLMELYAETPELSEEAKSFNSDYQQSYEYAEKREAEIARVLASTDADAANGKVSEFRKLAQLARGSMETIRKVIAAEAFGEKENGIASLKESDDLAVVTFFGMISRSPEGSELRQKLEQDGAFNCIHRTNESMLMRLRKPKLDFAQLKSNLIRPNGFDSYMLKPDRDEELEITDALIQAKNKPLLQKIVSSFSPDDNSFAYLSRLSDADEHAISDILKQPQREMTREQKNKILMAARKYAGKQAPQKDAPKKDAPIREKGRNPGI